MPWRICPGLVLWKLALAFPGSYHNCVFAVKFVSREARGLGKKLQEKVMGQVRVSYVLGDHLLVGIFFELIREAGEVA
eukprot:g5768.t1